MQFWFLTIIEASPIHAYVVMMMNVQHAKHLDSTTTFFLAHPPQQPVRHALPFGSYDVISPRVRQNKTSISLLPCTSIAKCFHARQSECQSQRVRFISPMLTLMGLSQYLHGVAPQALQILVSGVPGSKQLKCWPSSQCWFCGKSNIHELELRHFPIQEV